MFVSPASAQTASFQVDGFPISLAQAQVLMPPMTERQDDLLPPTRDGMPISAHQEAVLGSHHRSTTAASDAPPQTVDNPKPFELTFNFRPVDPTP
jgi:hypothetical protein